MMPYNNELELRAKLDRLVESFKTVLYEKDVVFLDNMTEHNLAGDDISKYQFWEWTQGVGLYGLWKLYENTKNESYLVTITEYYDSQIANGLPAKNINTAAPLLTLSYLYEHTNNNAYLAICEEWAEWIMNELPRTKEGGFQHITSDTENKQELWDDTLFMTVLFLANIGRILQRQAYIEEAKYQFLVHIKYLADRKTGLWFHGWTFQGNHNFVEALWGRGNCWITIAIPTFIEMVPLEGSVRRFLLEALIAQVDSLVQYQNQSGMWHTLLDDETSYEEASATSGIAYGILKSVHAGLIDDSYEACAWKAISAIFELIDDEGIVRQVSYGTAMGRESKDFYKKIPLQPMPYGQAIAMLMLQEALLEKKPAEIQ
ncbi:glycoside hydrolase family 105 protein [Paenibacillus tarimensis]